MNDYNANVFYLKFIKTILLTDDLRSFLENADALGVDYSSLEVLKMVKDIVILYTRHNALPNEALDNLYRFINICRFMEVDNDRKERFKICNEIITQLNSSKATSADLFYGGMIDSYCPNFFSRLRYQLLYSLNPKRISDELGALMELEWNILCFHSELVSDEQFAENVDSISLDLHYLIAVNHLLKMYPGLLNDSNYLDRLGFIIKNNELLHKQYRRKNNGEEMSDITSSQAQTLGDRHFWRLNRKIKKKVLKVQKDS